MNWTANLPSSVHVTPWEGRGCLWRGCEPLPWRKLSRKQWELGSSSRSWVCSRSHQHQASLFPNIPWEPRSPRCEIRKAWFPSTSSTGCLCDFGHITGPLGAPNSSPERVYLNRGLQSWCGTSGPMVHCAWHQCLAQWVTVILIVVIFIILVITLKPSEAETLPSQVEAASRFWISNSSHTATSRRKSHLVWRREIPVWGGAPSLSYRCPVPLVAPSSSYEVNCTVALFQGNKFLM